MTAVLTLNGRRQARDALPSGRRTEGTNGMSSKKDDDDKLQEELKAALKEDKDSEPVKRAGKSKVVSEAFGRKHGKGSKNGKR